MSAFRFFLSTAAMALLALTGCDGGGGGGAGGNTGGAGGVGGAGGATGGGGGAPALKWYSTCGDPACGMPSEDPNLADCTTEQDGDPCTTEGSSCEVAGDNCNVNLVCATVDPKGGPNGCPISLASAKNEIVYLTDADRERIREDVLTMPLATWKYKTEGGAEKDHLGFIIDDQPPASPAVRPSGERVDLYGYTSMAVAAIQAQHKQIEALRAEIATLRADLASAQPICGDR